MSIEDDCGMPREPESLSHSKAFGLSNKEQLFFIHANCSMNPTLWEKDLLEVVRYEQKNDIRKGDVIVFVSPVDKTILAHRVIDILEEGICTKGDNNCSRDLWLLGPDAIFGKVVAVSRNKEHHMISGGMAGLLKARWSNKNQKMKTRAIRRLYPIYRAASKIDIFKSCGSHIIKPKIAIFKEKGKSRIMLLSGNRVIGSYNEDLGEWNINYLYRFFISSGEFQKKQLKKE